MAEEKQLTREFFQEQGRIGGKLGGGKSLVGLTAEQRSEYMRKLAAKRKNPGRKKKQTL